MKSVHKIKKVLFGLTIGIAMLSCNSGKTADEKLDDNVAQNVAIAFAQASTKGDFKKAMSLLLQDSTNLDNYNIFSQRFNTQAPASKEGFKQASLQNWRSQTVVLDSVYIYTYTNSFDKRENSLKLVKQNGKWKVDFTSTFNGNN
jgi:hypothetical protein